MQKHTNHLISETSPYLLQHAHNPVNWYPWGEEALEKAKKENRPILVSIGYSACHWCHVMERESFEDEGTARMMNEHFVNIKIDREERPDLDHIYMDAVQAMAGSGGWPLNVFLTPDGKPFYGGTYYPPQRAFNRPSWKEILLGVSQAFEERRNEINEQADNLTSHLVQSNSFGQEDISSKEIPDNLPTKKNIDDTYQNVMKTADKELGGFGTAPKFPQTFTIQFLLRYHWLTKNEDALRQALLSLDKMIEGGIYDQVGGGFARYSTDAEWLVPHFEKMLYDNALLISVLSEAYQLTNKKKYKEVIDETIGFVKRELFQSDGGFYSALDADSEGEEGKFYVWEYKEVVEILHEDAVLFCEYFDITPTGNWEDKNIPRISGSPEAFAEKKSIPVGHLKEILERGRSKLREKRSERPRPMLDDKIILGWNALMNRACSLAFAATGNKDYRQLAEMNMRFILEKFKAPTGDEFYHNWKNGAGKNPAFLDDYAFLIQALIDLHEITVDTLWLVKAKDLIDLVIRNFSEEETGFFFFTHRQQKDVIMRKKEVYDGALPSGNAVMANNLHRLSILFDKSEWRMRAQNITNSLGGVITRYPGSFGVWASLLQEIIYGTHEIAVVGKDYEKILREILVVFIPHKVVMASDKENKQFPLLAGKSSKGKTQIYLCKNFSCLAPFFSVKDFMQEIKAEMP